MGMNLPWPNLVQTTPRKVTPPTIIPTRTITPIYLLNNRWQISQKLNREGSRPSMLRKASNRGTQIIKNRVDNAIRVGHLFSFVGFG
jgi:hypothetical protein